MVVSVNVEMQDGSLYTVHSLLANGDSNTKLRKSNASGVGYLTVGLSLSPARESGYEMCASRSPGCTEACLFTAGFGVYENVKIARIAKTRLFFQDRAVFKKMLFTELDKWERKARKQGKRLACRLNIVSDAMWEVHFPELFTTFPNVQFYDYTKHYLRTIKYCEGLLPKNYHLTFSRSETNDNEVNQIIKADLPINIAVVFDRKELPLMWRSRFVINGDKTDLRFLDLPHTIVGLYAKGKGKKDNSGFVIQLDTSKLKV